MGNYRDDTLVKPAYRKIEYTREQIDELMKCFDPVTGPLYFIENFMYIQHPVRGREQIKLYKFQYGLLDNYHGSRKSINMISRQMGKCLEKTTLLRIKSKITGEIQEISFENFEKLLKFKE